MDSETLKIIADSIEEAAGPTPGPMASNQALAIHGFARRVATSLRSKMPSKKRATKKVTRKRAAKKITHRSLNRQ